MFNINHIAITVVNREQSIEFYKKFGFEEFKSWKSDDGCITIDMLKLNSTQLEIFCYKEYSEIPELAKATSTVGTKHLALGVENIEEAKKFIIKNKIANDIEIKIGKLGKPYFFIKDPDGISVEIIENG